MFQQTFAITRNTFFESIRQPIMLVVLVIATIALILSNPLSAFTMEDDQRMLLDIGLATIFLCGCLLAAFIATNVLGREIENRTALTVISKPVSRPIFVIGKFIGVAAALALGTAYMAFVFMLVEQHSVLQTVRDPLHGPVWLFGGCAAILGVAISIWCNYFYNKVFASTFLCVTTPLAGLAYVFSMMFRADFSLQPISVGFKPQLWLALGALLLAIMVLTAIAVAASTRLGQVMTLCVTLGVFLAGMLSDWFFGRPLLSMEQEWTQRVKHANDDELARLVSEDDVEAVRGWVLDIYNERAARQFRTWPCAFRAEVESQRRELNKMTEPQRQAQIAAIEADARRQASERLRIDRDQAQQAAAAVHWPLTGLALVHEMDWPIVLNRTNGECEAIANQSVLAYPPARWAVASGDERITYLALRAASSVVPNFQVLWLSDALTQGHRIPVTYLGQTSLYSVFYIIASLSLATLLFQRREVG